MTKLSQQNQGLKILRRLGSLMVSAALLLVGISSPVSANVTAFSTGTSGKMVRVTYTWTAPAPATNGVVTFTSVTDSSLTWTVATPTQFQSTSAGTFYVDPSNLGSTSNTVCSTSPCSSELLSSPSRYTTSSGISFLPNDQYTSKLTFTNGLGITTESTTSTFVAAVFTMPPSATASYDSVVTKNKFVFRFPQSVLSRSAVVSIQGLNDCANYSESITLVNPTVNTDVTVTLDFSVADTWSITSTVAFSTSGSGNLARGCRYSAQLTYQSLLRFPSMPTDVNAPTSATTAFTFDTPVPPSAPTSPQLTSTGATSFNMNWTPPTSDGYSAITGYLVQILPNDAMTGGATVWCGLFSPCAITGIASPDIEYVAKVKAINLAGEGAWSDAAAITLNHCDYIPGININWSACTKSNQDFTGIDFSTSNFSGTTITNSNFTSGNLSYLNFSAGRISSSTFTGADLSHSDWTGTTLTGSNLTNSNLSHSNLTNASFINANFTGADLSYSDLTGTTHTGSNLTNSNLSQSNLSNASLGNANLSGANLSNANLAGANLSTATFTYSDTSKTTGTNITGGETATLPADWAIVNGTLGTTASAPFNIHVSQGKNLLRLSWFEPLDTGGLSITGYEVTDLNGAVNCVTVDVNVCEVRDLTQGASRTYAIRARNAAGLGAAGSTGSNTVITTPSAPRDVNVSHGDRSLTVSWTAPQNNGGSTVTAYRARVTPGDFECVVITNACTISELTNGTSYHVTVEASNLLGYGDLATVLNNIPFTTPDPPSDVTATPLLKSALVQWVSGTSNGSAIVRYTAYSIPAGFSCVSVTTSCTMLGLTPGVNYTFTVVATNGAGASLESAPSTAIAVFNLPAAPTGFKIASKMKAATFTWKKPVSDGGSPVLTYTVSITPGKKKCITSKTSCTIKGLAAKKTYTATLKVQTAVGSTTVKTKLKFVGK